MVAAWGGVGTVEMQREKLGLGYILKDDCGLLRNDSGHQHRGDCLQDRQWDFGALFSFLILSSSQATSGSYAASRLLSLHFGSSLPLSLVTRFPGGPHTSEGPEALCYVDMSFSMVLS